MRMCTWILYAIAGLAPAGGADLRSAIDVIRGVGPNSQGSAPAAQAWRQLAGAEAGQLPELLAGMDGTSALARNWLRSALDEVIVRAHRDSAAMPIAGLEAFVRDRRHDPQARRLAFELIQEADKTAADRFLPSMADDPSSELRHDAIARIMAEAEKSDAAGKKDEARDLFRKALATVRDKDQITKIAKRLKDLGQPVDLATHLGLITEWKVVGPFPNPKEKGMDMAYPPERAIDLNAEYEGKDGKIRWKDFVTKEEYGIVSLSTAVTSKPPAVAYALYEFTSADERPVELRIGCLTSFKLWVNGELSLVRSDAYTGMSLDHYIAKAPLRRGKNVIVLKIGVDAPTPGAPEGWRFQLRVCDADGVAVLSTSKGQGAGAGGQRKAGRQEDKSG